MRCTLINIGNCPSLALRSLVTYARLEPVIRARVEFCFLDYDVQTARATHKLHCSFTPSSMLDEILEDTLAGEPDVVGLGVYIWNVDLVYNFAERLHTQHATANEDSPGRARG